MSKRGNDGMNRWAKDECPGLPAATVLALSMAGCGGSSESQPVAIDAGPWFSDGVVESGITFVHTNGHGQRYLMPETISGGGALLDLDDDGDLDLYLIQGGDASNPGADGLPNHLYENLGDGRFRDITAESGTGDTGYGMGAACGDYDNDGDTDLYVTNLGANVLYRNEGEGRFVDVTRMAGVGDDHWGTSTAFLDFDRDGDLDLYVCNYVNWSLGIEQECTATTGTTDYCSPKSYQVPDRDVLYRNDGDGTFSDVSVAAGLGQSFGNGLGLGCADFDGNGYIDIFVANDQTLDQLWMNQGDGTFVDEAVFMGCAVDENGLAKAGMGVAVADIDLDGDQDVMVCNINAETDSLYLNQGGFFTDSTARMGLGVVSRTFTRFGMGWVDLDNDGLLDLYQANGRVQRQDERWSNDPYAEPNVVFRGTADGFEEIMPRGGTAVLEVACSRAAVFGDIDNDGGVDVVVVNQNGAPGLLRNVREKRGHWIMFKLVNQYGGDALGAELRARVGSRWIASAVRPGYSFQASNDPRVHIGLGAVEAVDEISITWPDGRQETHGGFVADRIHRVQQGGE